MMKQACSNDGMTFYITQYFESLPDNPVIQAYRYTDNY
jgi:hypothetical protein